VCNLSIIVDDSSNFYHCLAIESGAHLTNTTLNPGPWTLEP